MWLSSQLALNGGYFWRDCAGVAKDHGLVPGYEVIYV